MKRYGFTLVELLIVVAVIALLSTVIFSGNIQSIFQRTRDSKRKQDLIKVAKLLENYYNDHQKYPDYNPTDGSIGGSPWGGPFGSYVPHLPTDPLSPNRYYYYMSSPASGGIFAIFAKLENKDDPDIVASGCQYGCGPAAAYNYQISSPNATFIAGLPDFGGMGGGIWVPSATPPPSATPTIVPTGTITPTPTAPPGSQCQNDQCCVNKWCGGGPPPGTGVQLGIWCRCWYDGTNWVCKSDILCLF